MCEKIYKKSLRFPVNDSGGLRERKGAQIRHPVVLELNADLNVSPTMPTKPTNTLQIIE
jgi:hypothetical protein